MKLVNDSETIVDKTNGLEFQYISEDKILIKWHIASATRKVIRRYFHQSIHRQIIRVYQQDQVVTYLDIEVPLEQNYWTIKGLKEHKTYIFELGVMIDSEYFPVYRSHAVQVGQASANNELTVKKDDHHCLLGNTANGWNEHVSTYSFYEI